jgi:sulfotransferase
MAELYRLLGERPFAHDIASVEGDEEEYDKRIGLPGLHRVRRGVQPGDKPLTIPPDIYETYAKSDFWTSSEENLHRVPIL